MGPRQFGTFVAVIALPAAMAAFSSWRDKPVTQWTEDDARQVLTDSPWARATVADIQRGSSSGGGGPRMGRGVGISLPGGLGYPGGRRGRGGGGDRPNRRPSEESSEPPTLTVRWESSGAIQSALLKSKETDAPTVDPKTYTLSVIGLPRSLARDPAMTESKLKGQAELKRAGKKISKALSARVILRDDKLIVVYTFDRKKAISEHDTDIQLEAHLGRYTVRQRFEPAEMVFDGKLAL